MLIWVMMEGMFGMIRFEVCSSAGCFSLLVVSLGVSEFLLVLGLLRRGFDSSGYRKTI